VRESGVKVLARLLDEGAPERGPTDRQKGLAKSAREWLQQISEEDLPRVAEQARVAFSAGSGQATAELETTGYAGSEIPDRPVTQARTAPRSAHRPGSAQDRGW
jgi:hypothetical protein